MANRRQLVACKSSSACSWRASHFSFLASDNVISRDTASDGSHFMSFY